MTRRGRTGPQPPPKRRQLPLLAVIVASISAGIALAAVVWPVLGPLLAGRSEGLQATVGALLGAAAAAPSLLLLSGRRVRGALAPVLCWLVAAAFLFLWALPFRGEDVMGSGNFREQAGMFVPASVLVYFAVAFVALRRLPAEAERQVRRWVDGEPPADRRTRSGRR